MARLKNIVDEKPEFSEITDIKMMCSEDYLKSLNKYKENFGQCSDERAAENMKNCKVGRYIGFDMHSDVKHGWDCKMSKYDIFLENKNVDLDSSSKPAANFNDNNIDKIEKFEKDNVIVSMSLWKMGKVVCVILGKSRGKFYNYMRKKVERMMKSEKNPRNNIAIQPYDFVNNIGFNIVSIEYSPSATLKELIKINRKFKNIDVSDITRVEDFDVKEYFEGKIKPVQQQFVLF